MNTQTVKLECTSHSLKKKKSN
uniref:Uncharacterized protein n=1 Tax=Anguilla anguilla TaxID=7936 RepID=A0A0E9XKX6_ANGAN